jgi:hypothetical protein
MTMLNTISAAYAGKASRDVTYFPDMKRGTKDGTNRIHQSRIRVAQEREGGLPLKMTPRALRRRWTPALKLTNMKRQSRMRGIKINNNLFRQALQHLPVYLCMLPISLTTPLVSNVRLLTKIPTHSHVSQTPDCHCMVLMAIQGPQAISNLFDSHLQMSQVTVEMCRHLLPPSTSPHFSYLRPKLKLQDSPMTGFPTIFIPQ